MGDHDTLPEEYRRAYGTARGQTLWQELTAVLTDEQMTAMIEAIAARVVALMAEQARKELQ